MQVSMIPEQKPSLDGNYLFFLIFHLSLIVLLTNECIEIFTVPLLIAKLRADQLWSFVLILIQKSCWLHGKIHRL